MTAVVKYCRHTEPAGRHPCLNVCVVCFLVAAIACIKGGY